MGKMSIYDTILAVVTLASLGCAFTLLGEWYYRMESLWILVAHSRMFLVVGQVTGSIKLSTLHDVSHPALNLRARGERKGRDLTK
jgi:hypothetical protein